MARTAGARKLTEQHRAEQLAIRAGSLHDLLLIWRGVDPTDLTGTIDAFARAAAILTRAGFGDSAAAGLRYFRLFRTAEGVGGPPVAAAPATPPPAADVTGAIRGAALTGIITARRAGLSPGAAAERGFTRTAGEVAKLILTGGRMTVMDAVAADRAALGWARVTSTDPCPFCRMLAGRGPAYKSQGSAEFEMHGACACTAEPAYVESLTAQARRWRQEYDAAQAWARRPDVLASSGTSNDALNNYRRWLDAGAPQ